MTALRAAYRHLLRTASPRSHRSRLAELRKAMAKAKIVLAGS